MLIPMVFFNIPLLGYPHRQCQLYGICCHHEILNLVGFKMNILKNDTFKLAFDQFYLNGQCCLSNEKIN